MSVLVFVVLLIGTLLAAGCVGAVKIYLELMSDWMGSSEHSQGSQAVQAPAAAMKRQQV